MNLLEQHFKELVDYAFTATMEADLDLISEGEKKVTPWLKRFYFARLLPETAMLIRQARAGAKSLLELEAELF